MAIAFYKLKIKEITRETREAVTLTFEIPAHLKDTFRYRHGQYLTLRFFIDGNDERRSYSISSSPSMENDISVTVKEVEGGRVSTYINNEAKAGQEVDVMPPLGHFTIDLSPINQKNYVLFGGGSGITPLYSIMRSILDVEKYSNVFLVYSNRNEDSVIFASKIRELEERYAPRLKVRYIFSKPSESWIGQKGRLDSNKCLGILNELWNSNIRNSEYFVCGPEGMMKEVLGSLENLGIDHKKIHKESFTVSENTDMTERVLGSDGGAEEDAGGPIEKVLVKIYGSEHAVSIKKDETILIAGIKAGIDPPFSCQIGACSTCRAKLVSGKVHMEDADALSDDEIEEGYILTCTAHPLTANVVVDYDD